MKDEKTGFGVAALVLGIIGVVLSFVPIINNVAFFLGALAVIFAIVCFVKKKSVGVAVASIILGIAAIVTTLVMQAATAKAINEVADSFSDTMSNLSGENTDKILENSVDVTFGQFEITKDEFFDSYKLPVTVRNKGDKQASFSVSVEAVDANGVRIEDDTLYVNDLNAGQSQNFDAFTLITSDTAEKMKTAKFKVLSVSQY